ncbi:MAG: betaine--homocysteine S-methyltransferase [Alphaproteobacteria bacterium]|nr:betaine--homocysteine S-methyltransferase [Alphaproteobacteria bacterium]
MSDILTSLLAARDCLVADGAMGTNLFEAGLMTGDSPELWNVAHPEKVAAVHRHMVEAGADIILTNTFGANRYRLALHGAEDRVAELNRAGAAIAREVADAAGRPVVVAGSIGPTGEIYQPVGPLAIADGRAAFAEQAHALAEGAADVLWIETISGAEELEAAVGGAAEAGLPVIATMTFDTNGRTMMGLAPADAVRCARGLEIGLAAFGSNCGIGPAALVDSLLGIGAAAEAGEIIVAKGNCGIPEYHEGHIHYTGTPEVMAAYARMARDAGARIVGGCCGTSPVHLAAIAAALKDHTPGPAPDRAAIEAALGRLGAGADALKRADAAGVQRRGRRRRG